MSNLVDPDVPQPAAGTAAAETEGAADGSMQRLRDRTDELELIISSLTTFALISLPGVLLEQIASVYTHLTTSLVIVSSIGMSLLAGTCYGLAACFVLHLMARAYWVGLIGLQTVFPQGINWERIPGMGPHSRRYYQETLPDLATVIKGTDKVASSLFAVISMMTLSLLWFGSLLVAVVVVSGAIGTRFGQTNAGMNIGLLILVAVFVGIPIIVTLLDSQLAARVPALARSAAVAHIVRVLRRISALAFPERLLLPVQLTLQSNTRPFVFLVVLVFSMVVIVTVGSLRTTAWSDFTLSEEFEYLDDERAREGFRSTFYEDMAAPQDRLRGWPRIDTFMQSGRVLRGFLPYQPLRDNLMLDTFCGGAAEVENPIDCLRQLWAVSLGGESVPMSSFLQAERADLKMRGLIGVVPLRSLEPGIHFLEVHWNPLAEEGSGPIDDRYSETSYR